MKVLVRKRDVKKIIRRICPYPQRSSLHSRSYTKIVYKKCKGVNSIGKENSYRISLATSKASTVLMFQFELLWGGVAINVTLQLKGILKLQGAKPSQCRGLKGGGMNLL